MKKKKTGIETIGEEERKTQDMSAVAEYNGEKSNRAKVVEYEGDDYEDVPVKDDSFAGRTGNFFYHYKWHIVAAVVVLVIGFIGIFQMVGRDKTKADLTVLYAGPQVLDAQQESDIKTALGQLLTEDLNGDGERRVFLYTCVYAPPANAEANGKEYADDKLKGILATGEGSVMFIDRLLFETLKEEGGVETLEQALGY